jgi:hemerythrin superfamily protein
MLVITPPQVVIQPETLVLTGTFAGSTPGEVRSRAGRAEYTPFVSPLTGRVEAGNQKCRPDEEAGMDAIKLLTQDHKEVEGLFKQFEEAGDRAVKTKQDLVKEMIGELTIHTEIEEEIFYPAVKSKISAAKDEVLESVEEHHVADVLIEEIKNLTPEDEAFDAKVMVLIESVRHHKEEEEQEMFPEVRKGFSTEELDTLGQRLEQLKKQKKQAYAA